MPAKVRPEIEDVICKYLTGDSRQNALEFAAWLKKNKMKPQMQSSDYSWKFSYKGKGVGYFRLGDGYVNTRGKNAWYADLKFRINDKSNEFLHNEGLSELFYQNIKYCRKCGGLCAPGIDITENGKEHKNVCVNGFSYEFWLPITASMECIVKIIGYIRNEIDGK